ncbi:MAG: hypothetical protein JW727_06495 [Candidatus Aenigmarchaeota archaeon]|nr:hypothetical protein [Candidatus Aenigmarchaeota archaeon]
MDVRKEIVSALLYFGVPLLILLPQSIVEQRVGWLGPEADMILSVLLLSVMLVAAYVISVRYYFKNCKMGDPVREGLMLGILYVAMFVTLAMVWEYLGGPYLYGDDLILLALAMTPAVTVVAAIDAKPKRKKLFGLF